MTLWGVRFFGKMDPEAWELNASLPFDQRLGQQDVRGSLAWATALVKVGVLTPDEGEEIRAGLQAVGREMAGGEFVFQPEDEDIHTAVERRLGELIGPLAGKLHTGRGRNDQVATDLRLWAMDHLPTLQEAFAGLQSALVQQAEAGLETIMPGYTHLQQAQPLLLAHWWLSHFWPLQRDRQRLYDLDGRTAVLPLGSGALAGAPFPVNRFDLAGDLGFRTPAPNSLDAVSDRDFVAEFLFCAAMTGVHLSRLVEAVILFSSAEFGFFELSDAFTSGSSLMPQKKNPAVFELARGKSGALIGLLSGLLSTLKALPSAYDKDLQEDKPPLFVVYDTLVGLLRVLAGAISTLSLLAERMEEALDRAMLATDLAEYLAERGVPFRQAHHLAGQAVRRAIELNLPFNELPVGELRAISPAFDERASLVFSYRRSVERRAAYGGSAPQKVREQIAQAQALLG